MKDRKLICKFYQCEHSCGRGRDAVWKGYCTRCTLYEPKRGTVSARKDLRKEKLYKEKMDKRNWDN